MMNDKQIAEVAFWAQLYSSHGENGFRQHRKKDYTMKTQQFYEDIEKEKGVGLDLGCGPVSIFEFSPLKDKCIIFAIDPLLDEYRKLTPIVNLNNPDGTGIRYIQNESETIPFDSDFFDWVYCVNVLDHVQFPPILLIEIRRVLKDNGKLYLGVNFDSQLYPSHYELMNLEKLSDYLWAWEAEAEVIEESPDLEGQELYWGVLKKKDVRYEES